MYLSSVIINLLERYLNPCSAKRFFVSESFWIFKNPKSLRNFTSNFLLLIFAFLTLYQMLTLSKKWTKNEPNQNLQNFFGFFFLFSLKTKTLQSLIKVKFSRIQFWNVYFIKSFLKSLLKSIIKKEPKRFRYNYKGLINEL